jgi:hypothetical protein
LRIQLFPRFAHYGEEREKLGSDPMEAPIEPTLAQHRGDELVFLQVRTRRFEIAAKENDRDEGGSHDFGIAHLALDILVMMQGFETIVAQTVNRYNTLVHGFLRRLGFGHH